MTRATLVFNGIDKKIDLESQTNILDAARQMEIGISAVCGGRGLCGKCRIVVRKGAECLGPTIGLERLSLSEDELGEGYRLACCATAARDGTILVEVPPESAIEQQRLQVAGIETIVSPDPMVEKHLVVVSLPQLDDVKSDAESLITALSNQHGIGKVSIGHDALLQLPHAIRDQKNYLMVTLYGEDKIVWIEPGEDLTPLLGLAVDLGTTKIAAYLVDVKEGRTLATASSPNPQIQFGDDIISRISYAREDKKNLKQLQGSVIAVVNKLLQDTCREAGVEARQVFDIVVVGNTAMHHLFLGINPEFLAMSPFSPAVRSEVVTGSKDIGLTANPTAFVYSFPVIAGFVGGDAVADILATQLHKAESPSLMIDIGTNTEVVLSDGTKLAACSCASGPALEGACIEHGMRAETGAIERIYIDHENLEPGYVTIGGTPPRGICGSGVLDALAFMLKSGIVDKRGRIVRTLGTPRIRSANGIPEYVLAWKEETEIGVDITVTQKDVQAIQLAKAAIFAATAVLMRKLKIKPSDIRRLFLAGAFGTYVDPQSALVLGMYPDIPLNRIRFVGNSAGSGARMALISKKARTEAEQIARDTDYVELAADRAFREEFAKALLLPHTELERFPTIAQILSRKG
jgi:uncharacterized 2Fe-2S/4Fe-4S cluster protein (DUF4445 family)